MVATLAAEPEVYDTSRIFMVGCSQGAAFSSFSALCAHQPPRSRNITAWATHSTGISVDGVPYLPGIPSSDAFWPIVPVSTRDAPLKACVFDNEDDFIRDPAGTGKQVDVFRSSEQLAAVWQRAGNRAQAGFRATGGHCGFHDHSELLRCLDDGTHRLLP